MNTIGFDAHDHTHCIADTMQSAEALCAEKGLRFTPVRRRVLELLLAEHRAMGAYDILEVLSAEGLGSQPPVAYRALEFLVKNGLAHRVEGLNAYAACAHLGTSHAPAFLICRSCQLVAEVNGDELSAALETEAAKSGFRIERVAVELVGQCPSCVGKAA
ncbi:MAG: Fur family transcriptional regulator [Paracoccaceae bacterium]